MKRSVRAVAVLVLCANLALAADPSIKVDKAEPPKEVPEAVRKLLGEERIQFSDDKGKLQAELWFRKEVPAKATDAQIKNGLTFQEIAQTTVLGVVKLHEPSTDYKKQPIKAGLFTMRLAYQPSDGDHMGTAPYSEFVILVPVGFDKGEETLKAEEMHKLGTRASGTGHPAVWLLFPVASADLNKPPVLQKKNGDHWVLTVTLPVNVAGKKAVIGVGVTLIGVSASA